jgi:putative transposase
VELVVKLLGLSQRQACNLVGLNRATWRYKPSPESKVNTALRKRIRELAAQRRRFGAPRLFQLLKREGWKINHKRMERIYVEEGLALRIKRRKKRAAAARVPIPEPTAANQMWTVDIVHDRLACGKVFKCLTLVDEFSRECLAIEVNYGMSSRRVTDVLDRTVEFRGKTVGIRSDNGSQFAGTEMDDWAYRNGVALNFIRPGKPTENAFIESFNGRLREE